MFFFFSAYCDIMMAATYRKLLVYLLLKPPITQSMKPQKSDQNRFKRQITLVIDCAGTNYFVTVVMFMNDLLEIGISQTKVIYTYKHNIYNLCKFVDKNKLR